MEGFEFSLSIFVSKASFLNILLNIILPVSKLSFFNFFSFSFFVISKIKYLLSSFSPLLLKAFFESGNL